MEVIPMAERPNKVREILDELDSKVPAIEALAVVSVEGLPIESKLPQEIDETRVAAMTAAIISLGERAAMELNKGILEHILVRGTNGILLVMYCGENAVLTVSTTVDVKLGLIMLDCKRSAQKIALLI